MAEEMYSMWLIELMTLVKGMPEGRPERATNMASFTMPLAGAFKASMAEDTTGDGSMKDERISRDAAVTAADCVLSHLL